jgi:predicted O-linked N-acetylglucosamine transferase (SPINDLY family)
MRAADLFLDTFPCNAHTTASDALWAGLPLLSCAGDTFASRVAGSLLRAVGMDELVTGSLEDYEALGIRLARDRDALAALRARLAQQRGVAPLFDTPRFVRDLERAYEEMWRLHASGARPRLIEV